MTVFLEVSCSKKCKTKLFVFFFFTALNDGHQPSENSQDSLSANRIKMNNTFLPPSEQAPIDVQINMKLKEVGHAGRPVFQTSFAEANLLINPYPVALQCFNIWEITEITVYIYIFFF